MRLLANTAAAAEFLPELLADFLHINPNVDVDLGERPSPEVARAVAEEEAEVGIAAGHADFSGLEALPFRTDRLVLITPPDHPLAGRGRVTFAEALGFEFVGLTDESALGGHLAGHAARASGRMRTRVRVRGLDTTCRMVALGAGVAVVPEAAAQRWATQEILAMVRMEDPWAERELMVIVRRLDALSPHARKLADHLAGPSETARMAVGGLAG